MKAIYFNLDSDGYLDGVSSTGPGYRYRKRVSVDHEVLTNPEIFKYIDGELIKDEERQRQLIEESETHEPSKLELLQQDNEMLAMAVLELTKSMLNGGD